MPDQSPDTPTPPAHKKLSLRRNFGWAFFGNLVFSGATYLVVVVLAKFAEQAEVGRYDLARAICIPIFTLAGFQLRAIQVTDIKDQFKFGHFYALRIFSTTVALAVAYYLALTGDHIPQMRWLIILIGTGQGIMLLRDVFHAYMQKHERMDAVARSKIASSVGSIIVLTSLIILTDNIIIAIAGMMCTRLAALLLLDIKNVASLGHAVEADHRIIRPLIQPGTLLRLVWTALPLALTTTMINLVNQMPRYAIKGTFPDKAEDMLGIYGPIAMLPLAGMMVNQAAGMSALPRLSRYYSDRNIRAYFKLLVKLIGIGAVVGTTGLIIVSLFGKPLLATIYKPIHAEHNDLFFWLMVYGAITYMVSYLGYGMTATRHFKIQLPLFTVVLAITTLGCWQLIPTHGMVGAAWSMSIATVFQGVATLGVIAWAFRRSKTEKQRPASTD